MGEINKCPECGNLLMVEPKGDAGTTKPGDVPLKGWCDRGNVLIADLFHREKHVQMPHCVNWKPEAKIQGGSK